MGEFQPVLNTVIGGAILGVVTWLWSLWKSHTELRLKVAEEYPKGPAMTAAIIAAIAPLQVAIAEQGKVLGHQGRMIEKIADRLHIPPVGGNE